VVQADMLDSGMSAFMRSVSRRERVPDPAAWHWPLPRLHHYTATQRFYGGRD